MYSEKFINMVKTQFKRLDHEMSEKTPLIFEKFKTWFKSYYKTAASAEPFLHPRAFPLFLFPMACEEGLGRQIGETFQADLIYSSINGYHYIRLADNVMDREGELEVELLPALNFFHFTFQEIYSRYFSFNHPFWSFFQKTWLHSAEMTFLDSNLEDIDQETFARVAARKICAAKIPLAAVCYLHNREDLLSAWCRFIDFFGQWHQMYNDLFDWKKDLENKTPTYILYEANRRKAKKESLESWMIKEGYQWGFEYLKNKLALIKTEAEGFGSPELSRYLKEREKIFLQEVSTLEEDLNKTALLIKTLQKFGARL